MAKSTASLEALIAKHCSCSVKAKSPFCIEVPDNANSPFNRNKPALCSGANSTVCSPYEKSKRRARTGVSMVIGPPGPMKVVILRPFSSAMGKSPSR